VRLLPAWHDGPVTDPDLDLDGLLAVCASLPAAELSHPFGPELAVAKVRGKVFAIVPLDRPVLSVTLKAAPEHGEALRRVHPEVTPGWHMDKRHWITVRLDGALDRVAVEDLVANSWDQVVAGLPRARRPLA